MIVFIFLLWSDYTQALVRTRPAFVGLSASPGSVSLILRRANSRLVSADDAARQVFWRGHNPRLTEN
jgi:hypothetical protein